MSNEPTIEQMNEAIALFMGGSSIKEHGGKRYVYYPESCARGITALEYHSSWDLLMPVGKKIYDLLAEMAKKRPPSTACHGDMLEVDIHCHIREYNLSKAHEAIYQFIQWYNKQKEGNNG